MDEDMEANGVGRKTSKHDGPYYPSKLSQCSPKNICISVIAILVLFVIRNLLFPFMSPWESLFRHILLGSGEHTLAALVDYLDDINQGLESADIDQFKNQFALTTWTIQGCANALAGEVWDMDKEI